MQRNNYKSIDNAVDDSLKKIAGVNGISKMVKFINIKIGRYKSYEIDDQYIVFPDGENGEISYNYKLRVVYDKGIIDEIIGFRKKNGSKMRINSYHANSDLLIR